MRAEVCQSPATHYIGDVFGALKAYARLFPLRLVTLPSNLHALVSNGEE